MKAHTLSVCCALAWTLAVPAHAQTRSLSTSIEQGRRLTESRCFACHSLDTNRVGPALQGVVGRPAGKAEGYLYSKALAAAIHTWTVERLKAWLTDPENVVPGQEMNYRLDSPQDREDVVAYLASISLAGKP